MLKFDSCLTQIFIVAVALYYAANVASAATIDAMKHAEQLFSVAKYEDAASWYKTELTKNPGNASAHYMLGVSLVKLNRGTEAVEQFKLAKDVDKTGAVSGYAESYLKSLIRGTAPSGKAISTEPQNASSKTTSDSDVKSKVETSGGANNATAEKVGKVSNSASAALEAECDKEVERIHKDANQRIQWLTTKAEKSLAEVPRSQYRNTGSYYQDQAIKAEYQRSVKDVQDEAARKEAEIKAHYRLKMNAVEDSAFAMHRNYESKNQVGKIILSPVGTNMNVRNYQTSDEPTGNELPVVAAPAKPLPVKKR